MKKICLMIYDLLGPRSLVKRFFLASFFVLPFIIIISGTLLLNAFQHSQLKAQEETLQAQMYVLLSAAELNQQRIISPNTLTEPRFNQQNSGLYAFIYNGSNQLLWQSPSALLQKEHSFPLQYSYTTNQRRFYLTKTSHNKQLFYVLSYDLEWFDENDHPVPLRFIIMSDAQAIQAEANSYRNRLWKNLGLMGVLLLLSQFFILRWGLQPFKNLDQQLKQLQESQIQQLSQNYPVEIQPVINSFNQIITQEKQQRERYRNTMADLAHSIKTPLAVVQSLLPDKNNQTETHHAIDDQLQRINQIISHQLKRAVIRVNQSSVSTHSNKIIITQLVDRLIKILSKVYQEKGIVFSNQCHKESSFYGDEADLLEVLGNLLDNACKYGKGRIVITSQHNESSLTICISDNGPGISQAMHPIILQRGERMDTAQSGQGIGLSIAVDIVSSYNGEITLKKNSGSPHESGACFCLRFEHSL